MSALGWTADGIERAVACGGVALEVYQRPGFTGGKAVRRADFTQGGQGFEVDPSEPDPWDEEDLRRRTRGTRIRSRGS